MRNIFGRYATLLVVAAAVGAGMPVGAGAAASTESSAVSNGGITYNVGSAIVMVRPQWTEPRPIAGPAQSGPTWSPDGSRFVFSMDGKLVSARLGEQPDITLTRGCCAAYGGSWTRDGAFIIYGDAGGLYRVAANGSGAPVPLFDPNHPGTDMLPTVAPNGTVVFERHRDLHHDLFQYPPGAAEPTLLIANAIYPSFSWDGTKLAYLARDPVAGGWYVWTANADGSNPMRLSTERAYSGPAWSPDGSMVLYVHDSAGTQHSVRKIDTATRQVTTIAPDGLHVSWQPIVIVTGGCGRLRIAGRCRGSAGLALKPWCTGRGRRLAGMTTTVPILSTLIRADGGQAWVGGHEVAQETDGCEPRSG